MTGHLGRHVQHARAARREEPDVRGSTTCGTAAITAFCCIALRCRMHQSEADLERGAKAAHTAVGLDADQIEAVVYGGTGR